MKFTSLLVPFITAVAAVQPDSDYYTLVYRLTANADLVNPPDTASNEQAILYLAEKFGVSDFYQIGEVEGGSELIIDRLNQDALASTEGRAQLVAVVHGLGESSSGIFPGKQASFKIHNDDDENEKLVHQIFNRFPKQRAALQDEEDQVEVFSLTNEMKFISSASSDVNDDGEDLVSHFKFFNAKLVSIWITFKSQFAYGNQQIEDSEVRNPSTLNLINDKLFINEMSQLVHLKQTHLQQGQDEMLVLNLNSLLSLGNKISLDSHTFQFSTKVLSDYLLELADVYDVTVVAIPNPKHLGSYAKEGLTKRSRELETLFTEAKFGKRSSNGASSGSVCYSSEDECVGSTSSCSSHGSCAKLSSSCWSCVCKPTFNKEKGKTTRWTGFDCHKKEISSEANLLFWTGLSLVVLVFGGVSLLNSIGLEPLPGVLDAATTAKKAT